MKTNLDKSLGEVINDILKKSNEHGEPKSIISNGYEFPYYLDDDGQNDLIEAITISELPDDVIITGFAWYIKEWKYYKVPIDKENDIPLGEEDDIPIDKWDDFKEEHHELGYTKNVKQVKEINKETLTHLFKNNV
ncbi:MAG: hypothetical protein LBU84_04895, partial [Prevotella sp.]|nr:hypothetical protein [Prevotella sp.]